MKILPILFIILFTLGCSDKDKSKNLKNDTLQIDTVHKSGYKTEHKTNPLNADIHYVGFINRFYFSNKNEAYVELYFLKDEITADEYMETEKRADSLIYKDDENSRHRFPASLSEKYFDVRGLLTLKIYDAKNKWVCNADFVRVEYLNQNISPCFIAVYKTGKKIKSDNYYGISNFNGKVEPQNHAITTDTLLTQKLLTKLELPKPYGDLKDNGTHIPFKTNNNTISVINSSDYSYIILTNGPTCKVLYKSPEPENISDITVVPLMKNGFPYLLTKNVKPDSDVMWDKLLYYDGTKYTNTNRQRIE